MSGALLAKKNSSMHFYECVVKIRSEACLINVSFHAPLSPDWHAGQVSDNSLPCSSCDTMDESFGDRLLSDSSR